MHTINENLNVDQNEIAKFSRSAAFWWDPEGQFKPLHQLNPVRTNYIDLRANVAGKTLLDVGCGGGLLSEAMAQRGANVTGIDMGSEPLEVAEMHAKQSKLDIRYIQQTAESHSRENKACYDVITCLEMLEHVPDPTSVIAACSQLVKPGGDLFFSTLNRNPKSYLLAILGAEYVLKWVPKGTHEYSKFIRPSELANWARKNGLQLTDTAGLIYNPIKGRFELSENDVDCNYIMHFKKH